MASGEHADRFKTNLTVIRRPKTPDQVERKDTEPASPDNRFEEQTSHNRPAHSTGQPGLQQIEGRATQHQPPTKTAQSRASTAKQQPQTSQPQLPLAKAHAPAQLSEQPLAEAIADLERQLKQTQENQASALAQQEARFKAQAEEFKAEAEMKAEAQRRELQTQASALARLQKDLQTLRSSPIYTETTSPYASSSEGSRKRHGVEQHVPEKKLKEAKDTERQRRSSSQERRRRTSKEQDRVNRGGRGNGGGSGDSTRERKGFSTKTLFD